MNPTEPENTGPFANRMVNKRAREEESDENQAKRARTNVETEKLSKVFSDFMGSYLKLNWVNEDDHPHIPPKYVLSDMIMEKFFKEAKWRDVADSRGVVEYINTCLAHHGMKSLDPSNFPKAYKAWKACFSKDFNSKELESAEVLCQLKSVLQMKKEPLSVANAEEEIETKPELGMDVNLHAQQQSQADVRKEEPVQKLVDRKPVIPQEISAPLITETPVNRMPQFSSSYNPHASQSRFQQHAYHHPQQVSPQQHQQQQQQTQAQVIFEDKKIQFNPKKNLFDLQVLKGGQWHILGSFIAHADAVTAFKCIRTTILNVLPQYGMQPVSGALSVNHPPANMPSSSVPPSSAVTFADQHETTTVVYQLPTQKVIQLIHRLPSINLSDPWQLTQLVCLYLCLFARISIKALCSLRETHVTVNTSGMGNMTNEPVKPFVTVVGLNPMCMKHLKCMCSEAHDMCNVLCVVTVLTLYQNQKNDVGSAENQAFVRGIALAPNGISRCLTNTPLRQTNKLQLGGWLSKITKKFN